MSFGRRDPIEQIDMDNLADVFNSMLTPALPYDFFSGSGWSTELSRIRTDLFKKTNLEYVRGFIADSPELAEIKDGYLLSGPHVIGVGRTLWADSYDPRDAGISDFRQFLYKGTVLGSAASFVYSRSRNPASFLIYTGAILGTTDRLTPLLSQILSIIYSCNNDLTRLEAQVIMDFVWTGTGSPPTGNPAPHFTVTYTVNGVDQLATDVSFVLSGSGSPENTNVRLTANILTTNCPLGAGLEIRLECAPDPDTYTYSTGSLAGFWAIDYMGPDVFDNYKKCIHPRNEIARQFAHFGATRQLVPDDFLDPEPLVYDLQTQPRAVDTYIRGWLNSATKVMIDAYPPLDPALFTAGSGGALMDDLNVIINETTGVGFYNATAFTGVTLRALTRWLIGLDDISGAMLELLNRLLLEDAYPNYLRRITTPITGADTDVVYMDTHSIVVGANMAIAGVGNLAFGFQCSDPLCDGIWIAKTLPPPAINGLCDIGLPNYYDPERWPPLGPPPAGHRTIGSTMRSASPTSAGGVIGQHYPSVDNRPSRWPVIWDLEFGVWQYQSGSRPVQYPVPCGYWTHDNPHSWDYMTKDYPVPTGETWVGSHSLPQNPNTSNGTYAFEFKFVGNGKVYVSHIATPDPSNPSTYDFVTTKKYFKIPDDVPPALLATYNAGTDIFYVFHNDSGADTTFTHRWSTFYTLNPDGDAIQVEPHFFPYETYPNSVNRLGESAIATYNAFKPWEGEHWPSIPTRGYAVFEIVVQMPPVNNGNGIFIPSTSVGGTAVKIGVMVGTGIFTGAITGVYPGEFLEFDTITIPHGQSRKIQSVFYPVLEPCPLAFQCDIKVDVFAYVNYQPVFHSEPTKRLESYPDNSVVHFEHGGPATMLDWGSADTGQYWMFRTRGSGYPLGSSRDTLFPPSGGLVSELELLANYVRNDLML